MALQYLRKPVERDVAQSTPGEVPPAAAGFGKLQALWEFLSVTQWDDGHSREPGTILVWFDGERLHGMLRDRHSQSVAFASASGLAELLGCFDRGIRDGSLDWKAERVKRRKR